MSAASKKVPAVPISDPLSFNPFESPGGWMPLPKLFFDLLAKDKKTGESRVMGLGQFEFLLAIAREVWFGLKKGQAPKTAFTKPHSILWISREIGIGKSQAMEIVADALDRGLVFKERRQGEREYRFRLAIENWASVPFYKPKGIQKAEDTPEEASEETAKQHTGAPVSSGRIPAGRTTVLQIEQTGQKLRAKNKFDIDIDVGLSHVADGLLEVEFGPAADRPAQVVEISAGANAPPAPGKQRPPSKAAAAKSPPPSAAASFTVLRAFLLPRFAASKTALNDHTLSRIGKAIDGRFEAYKELVEAREQRGPVKPGAYVAIAEQDLRAHVAQRAEVEARGLKAPVRKKTLLQKLADGDALV